MAVHRCDVCNLFEYDEVEGHPPSRIEPGTKPQQLPDDWRCPTCYSDKTHLRPVMMQEPKPPAEHGAVYLGEWGRGYDEIERYMADIHTIAETGESISEPMRTTQSVISWDDLLIMGAQLARLPLNEDEPVSARTVIGPKAGQPLVIETPIYVTHMSFGALSREIKVALAKGSAAVKTAMCSGEGGILKEAMDSAYRYIFEYVPNKYSVTDANLKESDAIEIKIGQSAKPGMGGHLPAAKVTDEIARLRGFPTGSDIVSPARFPEIRKKEDLRDMVKELRDRSNGRPVGIKLAAGHIEEDLEVSLFAGVDFVTIDGRPGATGSAPKFIKSATSVPTVFALYRARKFLDRMEARDTSLIITGGLRVSSDFAKALALGADAVAIGTTALIASACQQYRTCNTGGCPVGVTAQDETLRSRLDIGKSAKRLENFLKVSTKELKEFARLTGNKDIHEMSIADLCTTNSEISDHTEIAHV